ncbi:MAG: glucosamine-6-phosphate deaminase [Spirochaetaceae bacterium]|jgi:glucosamine-6-phosphate deaminase|nr:glucosamine-6-phosphate deaminase [Spirochaetaceae bacterium]
MRLIIQKDYETASRWGAAYIAKRIKEFAPSPEKPFVLGLPTGSSPLGIYKELIRLHREEGLSFARVVTFNMDEYVGLNENHPQSYHRFMWDNFFSHIDIPRKNVHILNGMAPDLAEECAAYEEAIASFGGIELFLGGMGADGHIAFNEPGSSLRSRTRVKTLTRDTKIANARFFEGDQSRVPSLALTVGVGTVMDAREVLIIVNGHHKARALRAAVEEGINHLWTLSCLQMHPRAIILCDEDATDELKVGTVRYFKDIERV